MTSDDFDGLLTALLDGELSAADGDELAALLRADPSRRRELRQHLVLWELWSQQQAPERSADSFLNGWRTRLRAGETAGLEVVGHGGAGVLGEFLAELKERISRQDAGPTTSTQPRAWWPAWRRPARLAWTVSFALMALAAFLWLVAPHDARATTTLHGEVVCTACILHQTHEHLPAILVRDGTTTRVYYVESGQQAFRGLGDFCAAPIPTVTTGKAEMKDGRMLFDAETVEAGPPLPSPQGPKEPILFPF